MEKQYRKYDLGGRFVSQPVNLSNDSYQKLKFFKQKTKQRSFSTAVEELLRNYWSPRIAQIQIQERFSELVMWLRARELMTERAEEAIGIAQTRIFQGIADKKKMDVHLND